MHPMNSCGGGLTLSQRHNRAFGALALAFASVAAASTMLLSGCNDAIVENEAKAVTPGAASSTPQACSPLATPAAGEPRTFCLQARVIAVGLQSVHGVRQVGMFHAGGPIPGNPAFLMQTRPGKMLDPERLLVATSSNFGAPLAQARQSPGAVLSIDPHAPAPLLIPPRFAAGGGQAEAAHGAVKLYTAQNSAFINGRYNRNAATADAASVAGPRYISINNAFGRAWIANSPAGADGAGTSTVLDPDGRPLDNAPSDSAGGVFAGAMTNRTQVLTHDGRSGVTARALDYRASGQLTPGDLSSGALGTAFLGASPDGSNFAVFAVATASGAVVQVHVQDGVDGLVAPGTLAPAHIDGEPAVIGMVFKWNADRALFVADPGHDRIAVLHVADDTRHFKLMRVSELRAPQLHQPIDLAAAIPEVANPRFASHTTLAAGSDLYVANRGDGSLLRLAQDGRVLARGLVAVPGLGTIGADRIRAIAVSGDAARIWLTLQGELPSSPGYPGALLEVSAFDANGPVQQTHLDGPAVATEALAHQGEVAFRRQYQAGEGLGPLFNARSCVECHSEPSAGGTSSNENNFVLRVGRVHAATGRFEPLERGVSPVARKHSTHVSGGADGPSPGIPRHVNVTSLRMPSSLYDSALIERVADDAILAHAINKGDGIRGRPNRVAGADGQTRIGRYGWKADTAGLDEMVANAFAVELGISNPLALRARAGSAGETSAFDDDGTLARAVCAYLRALSVPEPRVATP